MRSTGLQGVQKCDAKVVQSSAPTLMRLSCRSSSVRAGLSSAFTGVSWSVLPLPDPGSPGCAAAYSCWGLSAYATLPWHGTTYQSMCTAHWILLVVQGLGRMQSDV